MIHPTAMYILMHAHLTWRLFIYTKQIKVDLLPQRVQHHSRNLIPDFAFHISIYFFWVNKVYPRGVIATKPLRASLLYLFATISLLNQSLLLNLTGTGPWYKKNVFIRLESQWYTISSSSVNAFSAVVLWSVRGYLSLVCTLSQSI